MIDLNSPLAAQEIRRIVDEQVKRRLTELTPRYAYGIVTAVDTTSKKATVTLQGGSGSAPGFTYAPRATPVVGELVRVVILPTGDRYIDAALGDLPQEGGTAFPSSPYSGQRFWRRDLIEEYYWDAGVNRWLTTEVYTVTGQGNATLGSTVAHTQYFATPFSDGEAWLSRIRFQVFVSGTNNGSNYWQYRGGLSDGGSDTQFTSTFNTSALAAGVWTRGTVGWNLLAGTSWDGIWFVWEKIGAPGAVFNPSVLEYRKARAS